MSSDMRKLIETIELVEKLGNLSQLNVGWMTDILKQDRYRGVGNKFTRGISYSSLGNTSEVIDVGVVKNIAGIRKAMRNAEFQSHEHATAQAFALHIDNHPVLFAVVDADDLRTKRQSAMFAYDLSMFKDLIQTKHDRENAERPWRRPAAPDAPTSQRDKEENDYDFRTKQTTTKIKKFAGVEDDVESLVTKVNEIFELADEAGKTVTMKIASSDRVGKERGQQRRNAREVAFGVAETLADRLKKYKNSKRPTAQNVEEFVRMALNKEARIINFAGGTYSSDVAKGYGSNIDIADLMSGKPFKIEFKSEDPDRKYQSFSLHMRYANGQLMPWQATYYNEDGKSITEPLDLKYWTKVTWKAKVDDKDQMMRAMLGSIKENPNERTFRKVLTTVNHMKKAGIDWPELDVLAKSAKQELSK